MAVAVGAKSDNALNAPTAFPETGTLPVPPRAVALRALKFKLTTAAVAVAPPDALAVNAKSSTFVSPPTALPVVLPEVPVAVA